MSTGECKVGKLCKLHHPPSTQRKRQLKDGDAFKPERKKKKKKARYFDLLASKEKKEEVIPEVDSSLDVDFELGFIPLCASSDGEVEIA